MDHAMRNVRLEAALHLFITFMSTNNIEESVSTLGKVATTVK